MSFVASVTALSAMIMVSSRHCERSEAISRRVRAPIRLPRRLRRLATTTKRSEHHHAADRLARLERGEAGVDLVEADAPGDEFIEIKPAVEIGPRQHREIARRPRAAIARPADAFLTHQRAPAEPDFCRDVGLAQPDHLAARPHRLDAE